VPIDKVYNAAVRATAGRAFAKRTSEGFRAQEELRDHVARLRARDVQPLKADDFKTIGRRFDLPPAVLHIIGEKESRGVGGFYPDGRLTIAVEPQVFSKRTAKAWDRESPWLSYPAWIPQNRRERLPAAWMSEWNCHPLDAEMTPDKRWRLWSQQAALDFTAACRALSVGRFQVLVDNFEGLGFATVTEMMEHAYTGEMAHLDLCVRWFRMNDLFDAIRRRDWPAIATYNGTGNTAQYAAACEALYAKRSPMYA
jgi:hypothetical protein